MSKQTRRFTSLLAGTVLLVAMGGCDTNGSTRISSVGQQGPQGVAGPEGPAGPAGRAGLPGPAGSAGPPGSPGGSGTGLGSAGNLAVGGLVGPDGIAGTGLLANTGDPNSTIPAVSGVLVAGGEALQTVAGQGAILADLVDGSTPGGIPITGRVIGFVDATGDALVRTGNGEEYLVDGLTAATGQLVSVTVGNARVLGSADQSPLIGASLLSPTQTQGDLLTVGVGSQGELVTLGTTDSDTGDGLTNPVQQVVDGVTDVVPGLTPAEGTGGVVDDVLEGVTGVLGGPGG